ncbi:hypothetical protein B1992_08620 [Pseudoxanthomonas broegbernensis]|uniref:Uncharacterized protein n=1 Tax=Pseudoxanthomonas broegbernensis TaxID=83619 RepID=A0A7V8GMB7_9GAMM|nr:hypothetical protein [Pseudoxanthomonas broegbernensis]KAF1686279.1 hypothetical protein B1992_08620 [Pseudoxanthomonas broegbernensis]MBB6063961.1 thiol:disulfide interchange protein [Pseudoxanthomonas broegbernensis]
MEALVPLLVALSGLPALGAAGWYARGGGPHVRGVALRWALIALALFLGACGLYWARGDQGRTAAVVLALVVAVNALGVSLLLHLRRGDRRR